MDIDENISVSRFGVTGGLMIVGLGFLTLYIGLFVFPIWYSIFTFIPGGILFIITGIIFSIGGGILGKVVDEGMRCKECGAKVNGNGMYCEECSANLSSQETSCGYQEEQNDGIRGGMVEGYRKMLPQDFFLAMTFYTFPVFVLAIIYHILPSSYDTGELAIAILSQVLLAPIWAVPLIIILYCTITGVRASSSKLYWIGSYMVTFALFFQQTHTIEGGGFSEYGSMTRESLGFFQAFFELTVLLIVVSSGLAITITMLQIMIGIYSNIRVLIIEIIQDVLGLPESAIEAILDFF